MTDQNSPALLGAERRAHVLTALARDGVVRIAQLIDELDVTPVTLRRDLAQMEREGLLVRVHGGAVPPEGGVAPTATAVPAADGAIAVLVPSLNYYWPGVIRGMEAEARDRGFKVLLRGASYELQDERPVLERLVASEQLSGLIVAPNTDTAHAQDVIQWLADSGLPYVLVERDAVAMPSAEPVESVTTDHALGAVLAARHLAELGHRRVGLVLSRNSPTSRKIAAGWHAACTDLGLSPVRHLERILPDRSSADFSASVDAALDSVLEAGITGLLVHSDPEAMAVVDLAMNRGISVPRDLSIVAYDDEVAQLFTPALTAVSPPRATVGHAAIELLAGRIAHPDRALRRVLLSPRLIVRESTAAPRAT
ncbi:substrate-binding domain-containing protein [Microbacterium sp. W1N]|uniref:substrate-binding domain-containing protein n=1 Tax=Microbacterium festucae TaxID=2977531 RepID=UPI0021BFDFAC|nr:substrate-binding domain-containing protein [Microbacterium festucae]MCT9821314.1 substrate-binding domain-containing protein [Microbacterium festucae]